MMKKLITLLLVCIPLLCFAQMDNSQAQFPEAAFRSVNTYSTGTTYQPQITPVGSTTVYGSNNTAPYRAGRRNVAPETDPNDMYATPIGDVPFVLMVIFTIIYIMIMRQKKEVD